MKVYVSSTALDLREYRAAVIAALRQGDYTPICMEDYPAQDALPTDQCLHDVASCDIYVGLFAWRYGFIPPGYDRSITELEYREARRRRIPTFMFLLDDDAVWPSALRDGGAEAQRILDLREEIRLQMVVAFFKYPEELAAKVLASLARHTRKELDDRFRKVIVANEDQRTSVSGAVDRLKESLERQDESARYATRESIPILLPRLRGLFVDREAEREYLRNWLVHHDRKILLIVGPGGFGKTELTTKVLKEIAPSTAIITDAVKGILYLRCVRGDLNMGEIFDHAGRMAGKQEEFRRVYADGNRPLGRKLEYFFRELTSLGSVWIVMDNFEDLLADDDRVADAELREFLEVAVELEHSVRIVVTSRAVPRFAGDREVAKLDLSAGLPEEQAVMYLRTEGAAYGLAEADDGLLRAFVSRVHCIPKALESVVGYLNEHYPEITLPQLMADPAFLADFDRRDLEKGLKRLVARQYARQSLDAKLVLCALSIFPQPALQAALRFLLPAIPPADFAALVARLERNRLIIYHGETYDLHPVVRDYVYQNIPPGQDATDVAAAADASADALTRTALHARAVDFFASLAKGPAERKTISDFEPHLQEIYHLIRARQHDAAARVLDEIEHGYLQAWGHHQRVIDLREQLVGRLTDPRRAWSNLSRLGLCCDVAGRAREGIAHLQEALRIARHAADEHAEADCLSNLGHLCCEVGELLPAIDYCDQALVLDRKHFNHGGEGIDLGTLGWAHWHLGVLSKAVVLYRAALDIVRERRLPRFEGLFQSNLGRIHIDLGEMNDAVKHLQQAAEISTKEEDWQHVCLALGDLGYAWVIQGDYQRGADFAAEAMRIATRLPLPRGEVRALLCQGLERWLAGDVPKAIVAYSQACSTARETGDTIYLAAGLHGWGRSYHHDDRLVEARQCYQEALALNLPRWNHRCAVLLGVAHLQHGSSVSSREHLVRGMDFCRDLLEKTSGFWDARYHLALGQFAMGQADEALTNYREATKSCSAHGAVLGALRDLRLLPPTAVPVPARKEVESLLQAAMRVPG